MIIFLIGVGDVLLCIGLIVGGFVGNLIEWYDFFVYSIFLIYFVLLFFFVDWLIV